MSINWSNLSADPNPESISILEQNPEKINWYELSKNSSAIALLAQYPEKINCDVLFNYNTNAMTLKQNYNIPIVDQGFLNFLEKKMSPEKFKKYKELEKEYKSIKEDTKVKKDNEYCIIC